MATCNGDSIVQTIDRTECIGNSLTKINFNFSALDKAGCELSNTLTNYINNSLKVIDTPNIDLSYNSVTNSLSANLVGKVPNANGGAGVLTGMLKATLGTVSKAISSVDYVAPATLGSYATVSSLSAYVIKPLNPIVSQVLSYNDMSRTWEAKTLPTAASTLGVINGILKGNGTTVLKAVSGVDYVAPGALSAFIVKPTIANQSNQYLAYNTSTSTWVASTLPQYPDNTGNINGMLKGTGTGVVVKAISGVDYLTPSALASYILKPAIATPNQVLTYSSGNWVANTLNLSIYIPKPTSAQPNQVLTYVGGNWTAVTPSIPGDIGSLSAYIPKPTSAEPNQVLTYVGGNWVAGNPTGGGGGVSYAPIKTRFTNANSIITNFSPINGYTNDIGENYLVYIDGVHQAPAYNYTITPINGGTITFSSAPESGVVIDILAFQTSVVANPGTGGVTGISYAPVKTVKTCIIGTATYTILGYTNDIEENYLVYLDGIHQTPGTDYTITNANGGSITLIPAPTDAGVVIEVLAFQTSVNANGSFIPNPVIPPSNTPGQVLTWDGSAWVAGEGGGGGGSGDTLPIGSVMYFAASVAPTGWFECDGRALNKGIYGDLWNVIKYAHGGSGNSFNLPDLRGEFVRGWDHVTSDGRSVKLDANRTFGSMQVDDFRSHTHTPPRQTGIDTQTSYTGSKTLGGDFTAILLDVGYTGGTETRPHNVALLACIKYSVTTPLAPVAFDTFIPKPTPTPNNGDTLTYSSSQGKWIASAASSASSNPFSAKAWVNFDSTRNSAGGTDSLNTNRFIVSSYNISSVTKTGTGDYNVHFNTPMVDQNYCILSSAGNGDGTRATSMPSYYSPPTTTGMQITVVGQDWNGKDLKHVHVVVFGM